MLTKKRGGKKHREFVLSLRKEELREFTHIFEIQVSFFCSGMNYGEQWKYANVTVHNSKDLEPTQMPINDRLDKENVAHIHHGILCSHKKDEFMSFAGTWMKLETIILSKLTQEQKTKHCKFSLISGS